MRDLYIIGGILFGGYLIDKMTANASIGKIYDTYPIKPGGRVDLEWAARSFQDRKYVGGSRPDLIKYKDPDVVVNTFGLHSLEFGNWMNQEDRLNFMIAAAAGLEDMAQIFGVAYKKMGFRKSLSVAMGARGSTGAVAHFEPVTKAINQTKRRGMYGSFGHEYGHAIDRQLGEKIKAIYASDGRSTRKKVDHSRLAMPKNSIQYLTEKLFQILYWQDNGEPTRYNEILSQKGEYWNYRTEVFARSIERYLMVKMAEAGRKNNFLIKGASVIDTSAIPPANLIEKAAPYLKKLIRKAYE